MDKSAEKLTTWLFQTGAVRVSPYDKPFWYTSGTLGPYYINTHFLYGSEEAAVELLDFIDKEKDDRTAFAVKLQHILASRYESDLVYRGVTDYIKEKIINEIGIDGIGFITGGERRDWFFAPIVAVLMGRPCVMIYKDGGAVLIDNGTSESISTNALKGADILHIADLITEASSYRRHWIPAVRELGGNMRWSCVVVDRKQGGSEYLRSEDVSPYSLVSVDSDLFKNALDMGYIDHNQFDMLVEYIADPKACMKEFLEGHPDFLDGALCSDNGRIRERAKMCIEKRIYD